MTTQTFGPPSRPLTWEPGTDVLVRPSGRQYHQFPYIPTKIINCPSSVWLFVTDQQIFSSERNFRIETYHEFPEVEGVWVQLFPGRIVHKIYLWAGSRLAIFEYVHNTMMSRSNIRIRDDDRIITVRASKEGEPYIIAQIKKYYYRLYRRLSDPHPLRLPWGCLIPFFDAVWRRAKREPDGGFKVQNDNIRLMLQLDSHTRIMILDNPERNLFEHDGIGCFKPAYYPWLTNRKVIRAVLTLGLDLPWELIELILRYSIPKLRGEIMGVGKGKMVL